MCKINDLKQNLECNDPRNHIIFEQISQLVGKSKNGMKLWS